jgi:thiol-disulfide isomerase/thioredoxin
MLFFFQKRRGLLAFVLAGFVLAGSSLVLYKKQEAPGNRSQVQCQASQPLLDRLRPRARGEVAAVTVEQEASRAPMLNFSGPNGEMRTLEHFVGKTLLLNLWATWCVPCRKEMPALDALQKVLGGKDFEVVAINIDTRNLEKPRSWLKENAINALTYYADPQAQSFQELKKAGKAFGMPVTLLIDKQGCLLAHLNGPAEWASPDALDFVRAILP